MAQENDNLEMGSFSIQDTMELGTGNQQLLEGLFEPETASAEPGEVTPIIKEVTTPVTPKPIVKEVENTETDTPPAKENTDIISNFLGDDEDEDDVKKAPVTEPVTKAKEEGEDEDTPAETQFTALANDLFNLGVFTKDEDEEEVEINSPEEFLERFQSEKKKGAIEMVDNFISQFGEDYKSAFEAIFVKGVNPRDYYGVYNTLVNFAELDLSTEDNQVKVMRQALSDQGFEPEDVDTEIERLKNYGDLEAVAQRNHKVLVKKDAKKLQEMEEKSQMELQQKAQIKNQYVQNVQTVLTEKLKEKQFDGLPLNPKIAAELQDFLLVDKWKTASGETLTDFDRTILDLKKPENHATKVKLGLLMKLLEKDPTLSTIQRSGVTKKTDQLFGEVARQTSKQGTTTKSTPGSNAPSWWK
jgi:hypothetical protein